MGSSQGGGKVCYIYALTVRIYSRRSAELVFCHEGQRLLRMHLPVLRHELVCRGVHFLAVQKNEDAEESAGLWLLQSRQLPKI